MQNTLKMERTNDEKSEKKVGNMSLAVHTKT